MNTPNGVRRVGLGAGVAAGAIFATVLTNSSPAYADTFDLEPNGPGTVLSDSGIPGLFADGQVAQNLAEFDGTTGEVATGAEAGSLQVNENIFTSPFGSIVSVDNTLDGTGLYSGDVGPGSAYELAFVSPNGGIEEFGNIPLTDFDLNLIDGAGSAASAAADPLGLDIDVSVNGATVLDMGSGATAESGPGSIAIAIGDGSTADAGTYTADGGVPYTGFGDYAFADGAGSTAIASASDFDSATASDGATADSGIIIVDGGQVTSGANGLSIGGDSASASGAGSIADASGQSFDTATAANGGMADSGFTYQPGNLSVGGSGDYASANGEGSFADAALGNGDIASASGTDSTALAGGIGSPTDSFGNNDFAAAFDGATANATPGSDLFVIEPSLFTTAATDAAATTVPTDDFGLSSLGLEGLVHGLDSLLALF